MDWPPFPMSELLGIVVGALGGAAVGLEREWSGHASGPGARFGGLRTFTLIGGLGGLCGWMWLRGFGPLALVVAAGAAGLIVVAYAASSRREVDATTETAALVVLAAGLLAGGGFHALASGTVALTALLLLEKTRLHALVARLDDESLRAGLRFAVMAIVILPLLPPGPFGPYDAIRPRALWMLVLFFSGLSFLGYIARRAIGPGHGDVVAGLLGGIVSSTSVTITFARTSRSTAANAGLGAGVVAACTVMYIRVLVAVAVLHLPLVWTLMRYFALPFVVGIVATVLLLRVQRESVAAPPPRNPLALAAALQMTLLFQAVLLGISVVREQWGTGGMLVSGALLGLTDMDALTISMAHEAAGGLDLGLAARATAVGTISNAVLKLLIAAGVGKGEFRPIAMLGIAVIGITGGIAVALW